MAIYAPPEELELIEFWYPDNTNLKLVQVRADLESQSSCLYPELLCITQSPPTSTSIPRPELHFSALS